jgi:hypothetical protein
MWLDFSGRFTFSSSCWISYNSICTLTTTGIDWPEFKILVLRALALFSRTHPFPPLDRVWWGCITALEGRLVRLMFWSSFRLRQFGWAACGDVCTTIYSYVYNTWHESSGDSWPGGYSCPFSFQMWFSFLEFGCHDDVCTFSQLSWFLRFHGDAFNLETLTFP